MSAIHNKWTGFTIVELLIVIVVIAILATISMVSYRGFTQRARESVLQHDASKGVEQIEIHRVTNGTLPLADNCPSPAASEICLQGSEGTVFTYVTDHPTSPTSYQLMVSNGDTACVASGGSPPKLAYGTRFVTLTNMANNGDFSAGQTGWQNYCQNGSQCLFGGGELTIIANPAGRAQARLSVPGSYTDGDTIFYSARVRKNSGSSLRLDAYRNGGGYLKIIMTEAQFDASPTGQFVRHSNTRTFVASQGDRTDFTVNDSSIGNTFDATVDDVVIINLTAAFGAGNEPSVVEMNGILTQFENGYFSGTVTATY